MRRADMYIIGLVMLTLGSCATFQWQSEGYRRTAQASESPALYDTGTANPVLIDTPDSGCTTDADCAALARRFNMPTDGYTDQWDKYDDFQFAVELCTEELTTLNELAERPNLSKWCIDHILANQ